MPQKMIEKCAEKAARELADRFKALFSLTHKTEEAVGQLQKVRESYKKVLLNELQPLADAVEKLVEEAEFAVTLLQEPPDSEHADPTGDLRAAIDALKGTDHAEGD